MRTFQVIMIAVVLLGACSSEQGDNNDDSPDVEDDSDDDDAENDDSSNMPVISSLPVVVETYDPVTQKAGDVDFTFSELGSTEKVFLEFNGLLIDGGTGPEGTRLPHYIFNLPQGTPVYAMGAGTVQNINDNTNHPDQEIIVAADGTTNYFYTYDHVENVTVSEGESVAAGQQIGEAAQTKFEADINLNSNTAYCPNDFFDSSAASTLEGKLTQLMADWEEFKGDDSIYDEEGMYQPGCYDESGSL